MARSRIAAFVVGLLSVTAVSSVVATASAEGSRTSYIDTAYVPGIFQSSWWSDSNKDGVGTVVQFRGCSGTGTGTTVTSVSTRLRRQVAWAPDVNLSTKSVSCTSGKGDWGRLQAGTYRFQITSTNPNVTYLSVTEVYIAW